MRFTKEIYALRNISIRKMGMAGVKQFKAAIFV